MWILIVKFVIAGVLVIAVDYLASHAKADLAGLIAIMPALTLASYILVSIKVNHLGLRQEYMRPRSTQA